MVAVVAILPDLEQAGPAVTALAAATNGSHRFSVLVRAGDRDLPAVAGVRWVRTVAGDGVQDATETATAGALLGLFAAGLLANAPAVLSFSRAWLTHPGPGLSPAAVTTLPVGVLIAALTVGAIAGWWLGRKSGLPREIAYRYGLQLRRGKVVLGACVSATEAEALCKALHAAGAADVRVCSGRLRVRAGAMPDSLDLPAASSR